MSDNDKRNTMQPIGIGNSKITPLPVKRKATAEDRGLVLVPPYPSKCHHEGPFLVDERAAEVECGRCGEKLNPMWVLNRLAREETHWHRQREAYHERLKQLEKRTRTKCYHCGQMTPISGR